MKKLSLSLIILILISIIFLGWGMDSLFERYFLDDKTDPVQNYLTLGTQLARSLNNTADTEGFIQQWQKDSVKNQLNLIQSINLPLPQDLWQQLYSGESLILESQQGLTLYYWLSNHEQVMAFSPNALATGTETPFVNFLLTAVFYIVLLLLILLWLFPLIKSLQRLRKNAIAYGQGDFSSRIKKHRFTYIDDIENTFNKMADQIETLISDNKLISSAVSHDLRTPLARLRFGIDILSDTKDYEERAKYQEHLSSDIDEMQLLVEAFLSYARLEQNMIKLEKEPVDILSIIQKYIEQTHVSSSSIELKSNEQALVTKGHAIYLKMLFHNILNNATYYGHGKVSVELKKYKNNLIVSVHDNGNGIAEQDRANLFKPFVRGELKENNSGYGMGLAIAERISRWHQGSIEIRDSHLLQGAEFRICLPLV